MKEKENSNDLEYRLNQQLFARKPSDYKEIWIADRKEYAQVISEVRTNATKNDLSNGVFAKAIDD